MKKDRTFAEEAKAMEFTIKSLYNEKKYLEKRIAEDVGDVRIDRARLQMVNHFIGIYEGY